MLPTSRKHIHRFERFRGLLPFEDNLGMEEPLEIRTLRNPDGTGAEAQPLSVTMRTPGHDKDLVLGFLYAEDLIESEKDLIKIHCCGSGPGSPARNVAIAWLSPESPSKKTTQSRRLPSNSSCGLCGKSSLAALDLKGLSTLPDPDRPFLKPETIHSFLSMIDRYRKNFSPSGSLHSTAIFSQAGKMLCLREDIGRHNAMDKCVGALLARPERHIDGAVALLSGRVSWEMMQKAVRSRLGAVIARGAPTNLAVEMARRFNITLIGFANHKTFNLYHNSGTLCTDRSTNEP